MAGRLDATRLGKRPQARSTASSSPAFAVREALKGNLRLGKSEYDAVAGMVHKRFTQYYRGLEVVGGQIVQHLKRGRIVSTTGDYYEPSNLDPTPFIDADTARQLYRIHLAKAEEPDHPDQSKLVVCPTPDKGFRLAYRIIANNGYQSSMTGFVDAKSGELIREYTNVQTEDLTIGVGVGTHGQQFKLPTTYQDGLYYLMDLGKARPVQQGTIDWTVQDIASDDDNQWVHDGALVNVHAYLGFIYDYYYRVFGRHGLDDLDLDILSVVHYAGATDNAAWHGGLLAMLFYNPGPYNLQTSAALDVIAHEYSHGITQFTSGLEYYCDSSSQPGALNEAFSDVMGAAIEAYWQPEGQGFDRSDWVVGEDVFASYSPNAYIRSLADPNSLIGFVYNGTYYPYPAHLSQCVVFPNTEENDWGGVHFLATLYGHAYYLLAHGGTNTVSGMSVSGIGIDKATKIYYRAWSYYLTSNASFLNAANALLQSAYDLYGGSGSEFASTIDSMEAIGWVVN